MNIVNIHNSRCYKCKSVIYSMLQKIYGEIQFKYKANNIKTRIVDYKEIEVYEKLFKIYNSLVKINGYKEFVYSINLQRCDIYIPNKKIIIETDEIQHFTYARGVSLKNYPRRLKIGYDKKWYADKCNEIQSVDTDPKYRDEQRAWYDTIRDFLLILSEDVNITVRIPLGFHVWCSLNPVKKSDITVFKKLALGFVK